MTRLVLLIDSELPETAVQDWRELAQSFATYQEEPVTLAVAGPGGMEAATRFLTTASDTWAIEEIGPGAPAPATNAPMSSADFVWREDGRPDWSAMWTNFCELALYGGPPHRGEVDALVAPLKTSIADAKSDAIREIRRGIFETTGLFAEPAEPGWIAVTCESRKMAAWLAATILLENVEARCDGERLLLPAGADFELKNEVKSVITVIAKTHHYWMEHVAKQEAAAAAG